MITILYVIWFAIPSLFFIMAFWSLLEQWSGKSKPGEATTYLKQGTFVLICAILSAIIEQNFLNDIVSSFLDPLVPLGLAQIVLFPIILLLTAMLAGGSKPIQLQSNRINKMKRKNKR